MFAIDSAMIAYREDVRRGERELEIRRAIQARAAEAGEPEPARPRRFRLALRRPALR